MPENHARTTPGYEPLRDETVPLSAPISQNIESIVAFHEKEDHQIGSAERRLARLSALIGRPVYLAGGVALVVGWVLWNAMAGSLGFKPFDPAPFPELEGLVTLAAWLTTTVVLNSQSRNERLERHRAQLDLQVNLLTEQKVTKLILSFCSKNCVATFRWSGIATIPRWTCCSVRRIPPRSCQPSRNWAWRPATSVPPHPRAAADGGVRQGCLLTRQMMLPTSSATRRAPSRATATPTGRPRARPLASRKPVSTSTGAPFGAPSANGTNTTR